MEDITSVLKLATDKQLEEEMGKRKNGLLNNFVDKETGDLTLDEIKRAVEFKKGLLFLMQDTNIVIDTASSLWLEFGSPSKEYKVTLECDNDREIVVEFEGDTYKEVPDGLQ